ncbi:MAG: hypothetical protein JNN07_25770 [Verrucomicrobiales bacterium]|nr:hypothetical protein [Verrucomicrobiales bacterium]
MNVSPVNQIIGNVCVALAALVFLLPLQRLLWDYADKHLNDDRWVTPVLFSLIPLWLLLMVALLCMTASGGFDGLRLGRPALYTLTVGASVALAVATFVFIALYMRPGFTPRVIYTPGIYLIPFATGFLVLLSLNQKLIPGVPIQWLRLPWTLFAALSLVVCVGFVGHRLVHTGFGVRDLVHRILTARDTTPEHLAKISALDPQSEQGFMEILDLAGVYRTRQTREAATARLRELPDFATRLATVLESIAGNSNAMGSALNFLEAATLTPDEQRRLALPTRTALERFISDIPAPQFNSRERQKQLLKWGRKTFPVIIGKFTGTHVDFSQIMPSFEHALRPDDTRR